MSGITIKHIGNFNRTEKFLNGALKKKASFILKSYAEKGVAALASATPIDSGLTASSWGYELEVTSTGYKIVWTNSNESQGIPIAILIQYGHGTQNGSYIQGRDFINPAIRPVMDALAENLWEEVSKL